ncbi:MAG: hypothetical protein JRI41_09890, partial [Deltaproteobacteria bacterium]|nr:hypothetical protein [Deltaproteobacteria bacterium]
MIGVLAEKKGDPWIAEFFEIFKTPWEEFHPRAHYDAVLANGQLGPETRLDTDLLIIYGRDKTGWDEKNGLEIQSSDNTALLSSPGGDLPIYCGFSRFYE